MARIRSVHPSLFTDEAWVSCSPLARILYIGLWTDADDQGLFEWKPLQIKMRLLPGDAGDVPEMLSELVGADLIAVFEHGGKRFGAIRGFRKFQRPKKPNATHFLPDEWRTYVGLGDDDGETTGVECEPVPNQFPTDGEKSSQMEDGGEEVEENPPNPPSGGSKKSRRSPRVSLPSGFPSDDLIEAQGARARDAWADIDVRYQAERFRGWAASTDQRFADWPAAWRSWMTKAIADAPKAAKAQPVKPLTWNGPPDLLAALRAEMGAHADAFLRLSRWDADRRAIVTTSGTAADRLKRDAGHVLRSAKVEIILEQAA